MEEKRKLRRFRVIDLRGGGDTSKHKCDDGTPFVFGIVAGIAVALLIALLMSLLVPIHHGSHRIHGRHTMRGPNVN